MKVKRNFSELDSGSLTPGRLYEVIGIEADDYRIQNDDGHPYLYSPALFTVVDTHQPADWVIEVEDDGETYAYPPELNTLGFFEDYFDDNAGAILVFQRYLRKRQAVQYAMAG